jgi:molecular chaperone DnaK
LPQIEVEFAIDANGILGVSATDKATGRSQDIEISGSSGLSSEEIEKMKSDAESYAGEDKARREAVELKNTAEQMVYQVRKQLEEHGDKVDAEVRSKIESSVSNLEDKVKSDDKDAIDAALKQLGEDAQELGKAVYEATAAEDAAGGGEGDAADAAAPSGDEDVIDADFEVKE